MNEKAKRRIDEVIKHESITLNLYDCELTHIPNEINDMPWLETLNLGKNKIKEIKNLENLTYLKLLILSNNKISKITNLEKVTNLNLLDISNNQVEHVDFFYNEKISQINLSDNKISEITSLRGLKLLTDIDLRDNKIRQIEPIADLKRITYLNLSENYLENIPQLKCSTKLTYLNIGNNKITRIESLEHLTKLTELFLNNNRIIDVSILKNLTELTRLDLSDNYIEDIRTLERLNQLTRLDLSGNKIIEIPEFILSLGLYIIWARLEDRKFQSGIYIKNCYNLKKPPVEIAMLGEEVVEAYFRDIYENGKKNDIIINEAKVLVIGDGGTGKTSLVNRLIGEKLPEVNEVTTGIDVTEWKFNKNSTKYVAHLWDFGGQVMNDMMHRYFFSKRSLYILLDSTRNGKDGKNNRLHQYLSAITLSGRESKTIIVQNQYTGTEKKLNKRDFGKYSFLDNFYEVNLYTNKKVKQLSQTIQKHIQDMPSMGVVLPKKWMKIRSSIQKLKNKATTIGLEDYRKLCSKHKINEHEIQDALSLYFHERGIFLHFQENKVSPLYQRIILDREWVINASYAIFSSDFIKNNTPKGSFQDKDLQKIWEDREYKDYHGTLLELMREFEVCFKLDNTDSYLVPRMMESMPNEDYYDHSEYPLHFYFHYGNNSIPEGLFNRLCVRLNEMIAKNGTLVWNNGVILEYEKSIAEVRGKDGRIDIKITGDKSEHLSENLFNAIQKINGEFDFKALEIDVKVYVSCICSICKKSQMPNTFNFEDVKADLQKEDIKFHSFWCKVSREKVNYHELLKRVFPKTLETLDTSIENTIKRAEEKIIVTVMEAHDKTRDIIPEIFRKDLDKSQKEIIDNLFTKINKLEINIDRANHLIEIVIKSVDELYDKVETAVIEKANREIRKVQKDESLDIKQRLKLIVPIIPKILQYEMELSTENSLLEIKERWKKNGFKGLFYGDEVS